MKEKTGQQWSNVEKKIKGRMEQKRRCEKRGNRELVVCVGSGKWEIRQKGEKGQEKRQLLESL